MCSYSDGLLVVGQDAVLPLQVSLLLSEQQLKPTRLLLFLLHAAELLVNCLLQVRTKTVDYLRVITFGWFNNASPLAVTEGNI